MEGNAHGSEVGVYPVAFIRELALAVGLAD